MKKIFAVVISISLVICFAACSKSETNSGKEETSSTTEYVPSSDVNEALDNQVFVESTDSSNTYTFGTDNTLTEVYKGNSFTGKWTYSEDNDSVTITPDGTDYQYIYNVERDENGYITGISQIGGRAFTRVSDPSQTSIYTEESTSVSETTSVAATKSDNTKK